MVKPKPYRFVVRLPVDMKNQIHDAARSYRRSMNSEIVARLSDSFTGLPTVRDGDAAPINPRLERMLSPELSEQECELLTAFRKLTAERQAALVKLLR
ncbi:MAG: Arc family DNA-binding protein [Pseudomonadota bacterium]